MTVALCERRGAIAAIPTRRSVLDDCDRTRFEVWLLCVRAPEMVAYPILSCHLNRDERPNLVMFETASAQPLTDESADE